ncbi:MAG: hypothetical protein HY364_01465 [Candidatus Aenigmarchaeota archaeon]|nr:hypothetical protein [Candidatus Aenigmarchaeota archaeon]
MPIEYRIVDLRDIQGRGGVKPVEAYLPMPPHHDLPFVRVKYMVNGTQMLNVFDRDKRVNFMHDQGEPWYNDLKELLPDILERTDRK